MAFDDKHLLIMHMLYFVRVSEYNTPTQSIVLCVRNLKVYKSAQKMAYPFIGISETSHISLHKNFKLVSSNETCILYFHNISIL